MPDNPAAAPGEPALSGTAGLVLVYRLDPRPARPLLPGVRPDPAADPAGPMSSA